VQDEIFLVDDFAVREGRTRYRAHLRMSGGMSATAIAQAAALGCPAELVSLLGDDREGRFLIRSLRAEGVVTRRVVRSATLPTTVSLVLIHRTTGERRFVLPDRRALERAAPAFDLTPVRPGALLMVDGHYPRQAMRALRRARERGVPTIADFADARPAYRRMLPWIDYPIVPLDFVEHYGAGGPRETLRALIAEGARGAVVTLGAKGALALHDGRFRSVPARKVKVLDTTGAGDVFHGAFAAGLVEGRSVSGALALASRAAAGSCRALGGMGALLRKRGDPPGS
jgi:sulfofructose kinase